MRESQHSPKKNISAPKKRIVFINYDLSGGGAQRVMAHLINYLDKDKYDIYLVLFNNIMNYEVNLPHSHILFLNWKRKIDFFKLIFKLKSIFTGYRPDISISFCDYPNIISVISRLISRRKFKLIISERNYSKIYIFEKHRFGWLYKHLMKWTYPKADAVVSVSKSIESYLVEDLDVSYQKIKTIYNPLFIEEIRKKMQEDVDFPIFKYNPRNTQVLISVGRLEEQKRFDVLLRAFSLVRKKGKDVFLIILGEGVLLQELEKLSLRLNISEHVHFVGFQRNPYAWISKADIFVLSSDYEGFPNVLTEAMACGIPVVSTDCPSGPKEIITNGKDGILVPRANEEALSDAILLLLRKDDLRIELSKAGERRVGDFEINRIMQQYEVLLEL